MKPDCQYWSPCGVIGGGCCALVPLTIYGANPSFGGCNQCEHNKAKGQPLFDAAGNPLVQLNVPTPEQRAEAEAARIGKFRAAWRAIHTEAAAGRLTDAKVDQIVKGLPCGSCGPGFALIRQSEPIPPDADGQFALTVGWHNCVNAELLKPLVSLDEARADLVAEQARVAEPARVA